MSWRRTNSTGWAALSLQQQQKQKQGLGPEIHHEPFPDLPGSRCSPQSHKTFTTTAKSNNTTTIIKRPFSSVALPPPSAGASASSPAPLDAKKHTCNNNRPAHNGGVSREEKRGNDNDTVKQLKELYIWADESLIEDILAAVDGDFETASASLKAMVSDQNSGNNHNYMSIAPDERLVVEDSILAEIASAPLKAATVSDQNSANNDGMSSAAAYVFQHDYKRIEVDSNNNNNTASNMQFPVDRLAYVPVEPEWEEDDDIYLIHRKEAIRIMREASRHSKAAANSFMRGDHFSAQQLSQLAKEEWAAAEVLHEKAAREILSLRNEKNGIWKLDLHGLHASEAVKALQDRLRLIEDSKSSAALGGPCKGNGDNELLIRLRPVWLEVITGVGNHSRYGEAAIPAAVRSFLLEHSYRFDEARPGIVMVRPKFRQK